MKYFFIGILLFLSCSELTIIEKKPQTNKVVDKPQVVKKIESQPPKKKFTTLHSKNSVKIKKYCAKMDRYFKKYRWGKSHCEKFSWNHVRNSYWGNPIPWFIFGNEEEHIKKAKNSTMILCGVHGDEITPIKFCFDILNNLRKNPEVIKDNLIVIAPLVAPDSFFKKYPTRYNARGVDINRNFPTKDWHQKALKLWKHRYRKDKRRYPGKKPLSEQGTVFQVNLIKRYNPDKIISVHAPLSLIDYDGPSDNHKKADFAKQLLVQMSDKSGKYKIKNYPFFPGSLGNWAGNERDIPTYTLELPNSDWTKTRKFFNMFKTAIYHAIEHQFNEELVPTQKKKVTDTEKSQPKNDKVL